MIFELCKQTDRQTDKQKTDILITILRTKGRGKVKIHYTRAGNLLRLTSSKTYEHNLGNHYSICKNLLFSWSHLDPI